MKIDEKLFLYCKPKVEDFRAQKILRIYSSISEYPFSDTIRCPRWTLRETFADKRRLRNGTLCPIFASGSYFGTLVTRSEASALTFSAILEIFYIWMPVPLYFSGMAVRLRWIAFPRSKSRISDLNSNKNYHFSKVSNTDSRLRDIELWGQTRHC